LTDERIFGTGQLVIRDQWGNDHEFNRWPSEAFLEKQDNGRLRLIIAWDVKGEGEPAEPQPIKKKTKPF